MLMVIISLNLILQPCRYVDFIMLSLQERLNNDNWYMLASSMELEHSF